MFANSFVKIILHYVLEGSGSWKYNRYFPVAKGEGKIVFLDRTRLGNLRQNVDIHIFSGKKLI